MSENCEMKQNSELVLGNHNLPQDNLVPETLEQEVQQQQQELHQQQQQQQLYQPVQNFVPVAKVRNGLPCRVLLLDGTELRLEVEKNAKSKELVKNVVNHLQLREEEYFSCYYTENNTARVWLNHEKRILDQIKARPVRVTFGVKFYPNPAMLTDPMARYLLYLQVRQDILSGRLPCSYLADALLGSYVVQSELLDYDPERHGVSPDYVSGIPLSANPSEELIEKIAELHRQHRGKTPEECELRYLESAKNFALYGVHMHPAKDKEGIDILVGVNSSGLMIYKDKLRIARCTWPRILKIFYKRSNFYLKYRQEEIEQPDKTMGLKCPSYKQAKRLWRMAVEHHAFFRLKQTDTPRRKAFPLFGEKIRYPGSSMYETGQGELGSRPSSTLARSISRLSLLFSSLPSTAQTTPSSTYKPESFPRLDEVSVPTIMMNGYHPGDSVSVENERTRGPRGPAPVASIEDDVIDPAHTYEPKLVVRSVSLQQVQAGKPSGVSWKLIDGASGAVENVKPIIQGPERVKLARSSDGKMRNLNHLEKEEGATSPNPPSEASTGYPDSTGTSRGGSISPDPTSIITKNVFITAKLNPTSKGGNGGATTGVESLPSDLLNIETSPKTEGEESEEPPSYSGPLTTCTYTAPDGTVITEYKNSNDAVIETLIEKKIVVDSLQSIDHDKALTEAIRSVTDMTPDLRVEKIEIETKTATEMEISTQ